MLRRTMVSVLIGKLVRWFAGNDSETARFGFFRVTDILMARIFLVPVKFFYGMTFLAYDVIIRCYISHSSVSFHFSKITSFVDGSCSNQAKCKELELETRFQLAQAQQKAKAMAAEEKRKQKREHRSSLAQRLVRHIDRLKISKYASKITFTLKKTCIISCLNSIPSKHMFVKKRCLEVCIFSS